MEKRIIELTGIHNFRDYGGYATAGGGRVVTGRLFRSGQHRDATPEDLERVGELELGTVIDLRGDSERRDHPCLRHPDFKASVHYVPGETAGQALAPHVEAAAEVETAEDARRAMVRIYQEMPFRPNLIAAFRLYFDALAERDGAHLLHCLAGKDRTGVAVALLHDQLGVHPDDIMADYLLTNVAGNIDARIAAGARVVRENFGRSMEDAAVRALMSVQPEFLETAFEAIRSRYGSTRAYLSEALGLRSEQVQRIAERLVIV